MFKIENRISEEVVSAMKVLYQVEILPDRIQVQKTHKDFTGDFTIVVFPLAKLSRSAPDATALAIGEFLSGNFAEIADYNVVNGFLNIILSRSYWIAFLYTVPDYDFFTVREKHSHVMVEYSSPNTNKPLHLGHIRNNLIGFSISRILEAAGRKVTRVNLVNDRGIHICKSMLAWKKWGNEETPASTGKKGDHLVGDYYIKFEKEYKNEINQLLSKGHSKEEAENNSILMDEARKMLLGWENGDPEIIDLWKKMNAWVYDGFNVTYEKLGVVFDRIYYESDTYSLGREIVIDGLNDGILYKKEDGSVWIDLTSEGLDQKLLLRSDGTSVYMTQDLGTAHQRFNEYDIDNHVYVVGNEQNYHFQVLSLVLKKLGYIWAEKLFHLSYGMVELPEGKMKSREGKVVDADDLIEEMVLTAKKMADELGKLNEYKEEEKKLIHQKIGLGALKYFILKVDPKKNMVFDPTESIDFNGNTGPFIQYTYARIQSVLRKARGINYHRQASDFIINDKEVELLRFIYEYPSVVANSADVYNPSLIANHLYDLAREYNQFYHDFPILGVDDERLRNFRLCLSEVCGKVIEKGMFLLGIDVPERM